MVNSKETQKVRVQVEENTISEISKITVTAISIAAASIGIWAVACMISGISNSSGPISLISDLFKAIFG